MYEGVFFYKIRGRLLIKSLIIIYFMAVSFIHPQTEIPNYLKMAVVANNKGFYELSNSQIEKYINSQEKEHIDYAYLLYASNLIKLQKPREALDKLYKIIEQYPESKYYKDALSYSALVCLDSGEIDSAVSRYSDYREKFGENEFLNRQFSGKLLEKAVVLFNEKKFSESRKILYVIFNDFKKSPYVYLAYYYAGLISYRENNFRQAGDFLKKSLPGLEREEILPDANLKLGDCYFNLKDYEEAETYYRKVIKKYPGTLYWRWANFQTALLEKKKGNLAKAEEILKDIMEDSLGKLRFRIFTELSNIKLLGENWEEAEKHLKKIIEEFPLHKDISEVYLKLGFINFNKQDPNFSIQYFEKALSYAPAAKVKEKSYFGLGYTYYIKGEFEKAFGIWDKVIKEFPHSEFVPEILFLKGKKSFEKGDYTQAVSASSKLVSEFPESSFYDVSMRILVESLIKEKNLKYAQETAEKFLLDNKDEEIELLLGRILYMRKDFDRAEKVFTGINSEDPSKMVEIKYYMGKIYQYQGNKEKAKEKFLEILSYYPEFKEWNDIAEKNLKNLSK
jgi:tetratricopeptide (TPR) repeat protein